MVKEETIDRIRESTDIVALAEEYLSLKKAGSNFKSLCPFHSDNDPSFVISPQKQIYHCFGCGESGNAFNFIMKMEGVSFPEALHRLAERSHIKIEESPGRGKSDRIRREILNLNERAAAFYHRCLLSAKGKRALRYLKNRGLTKKQVEEFMIGYAPPGNQLVKRALSDNVEGELLLKADLVGQNTSGVFYDKFRDRIIFPIRDERGRFVGFGGRGIDDREQPKYLNTAQNRVFEKRRLMYGLYHAKKNIREKRKIIVLEGYMDVVAAHQYGVKWATAALGTSLTKDHVKRIRHMADEVILAFDSDASGRRAASRGIDILLESDVPGRVCVLPEGKDPEDVIRENKEIFMEMLEGSVSMIQWRLEHSMENHNEIKEEGVRKSKIAEDIAPVISKIINPVKKEEAVKMVSERLGVSEEALKIEMSRISSGRKSFIREKSEMEILSRKERAAREVLHVLIYRPELIKENETLKNMEYSSTGKYSKMLKDYIENFSCDVQKMISSAEEKERKILSRLTVCELNTSDPVSYLEELSGVLRDCRLKEHYDKIGLEIKKLIDLNKPVDEKKKKEFSQIAKALKTGKGKH